MKKISVVIPCFNEEENVKEVYARTRTVLAKHPAYDYEIIFIDNASADRTVALVKELVAGDSRVKLIVNARNFGQHRSPFYGLMQSSGDAGLLMAADMQDPPEMISQFIEKWEQGIPVVLAYKEASDESWHMFLLRRIYYRLVAKMSDVEMIQGFHGYGLLDKVVIDEMRKLNDPNPYYRGIISEIGFEKALIPFRQPTRKRGITSNNFYSLYDTAMLGFVSHSKVPLRLTIFFGLFMGAVSFLLACAYLIYKLIFWDRFTLGLAPVVIGLFLFSSIQLIFMGILGEYLGAVYSNTKGRPLVVEKERVGF